MSGRVHRSGGRRRCFTAFASVCALAACHSTPVADRTPPKQGQAAQSPQAPTPAPNDQGARQSASVPVERPIETPIETPIVAPPCLPPETAPQLKRLPKPRAEPPPAAPSAAPPAAPAGGAEVKVMALESPVESVLGKKVQGTKGEDLGRVVDVLADEGGRVRAAVIEFGGFLGVGNRRIAVEWSLLRFHPEAEGMVLTLSVSVKTLQSVPEFKNSARPKALMAPQPPPAPQNPPTAPTPSAAEGKK